MFLQGAMGFSILLYEIAKILLVFAIPIITIILTLVKINRSESSDLTGSTVLKIIWRSLLESILTILIISIVAIVVLLFNSDFSDN
jgi:cytochrome c oxidase assembly factor CtaG